MAVPSWLGPLNYLRIGHDNSGDSSDASWFLKYIIVYDLQTMEKTYFICQQWFAVEKDDEKWCLIIAYMISFLFIGISIIFILNRSIYIGDIKTRI
ncbi:unnamed protein product [Rotaria sp. Silwood1]|nr:unnamed protein product [Rotaria sp. Silwood1]